MDFLNDFDVSDDENDHENLKNQHQKYPKFETNFHEKHWFRTASKENQTPTAVVEIDLLRVADHFENGQFDDAIQILTDLRENTKNNRTHEIMLIDSMLQCWIRKGKISSDNETEVLQLLSSYQALIVDFGDQIQFLRTECLVLSNLPPSFAGRFKNQMVLLCELCGSFENWQIWEKSVLTNSEKFGVKLKMEKILIHEIEHAKGFVKDDLHKKLEKIRAEKKDLEAILGAEEVTKIHACFEKDHLHQNSEAVTSSEPSEFRAHESRSKNKLIPEADQEAVVQEFFRRFSFFIRV